jgi:hypothetical protein
MLLVWYGLLLMMLLLLLAPLSQRDATQCNRIHPVLSCAGNSLTSVWVLGNHPPDRECRARMRLTKANGRGSRGARQAAEEGASGRRYLPPPVLKREVEATVQPFQVHIQPPGEVSRRKAKHRDACAYE